MGHCHLVQFFMSILEERYPQDVNGNTPFHTAAYNGQVRVCNYFLDTEEDKNPVNSKIWRTTPLHLAATNGHFNVCKRIMRKVFNKNPKDGFGITPYHRAASNGPA